MLCKGLVGYLIIIFIMSFLLLSYKFSLKDDISSSSKNFEKSANDFLAYLESSGFDVVTWTRLPYYDCPVDGEDFHFHSNILVLLKKINNYAL